MPIICRGLRYCIITEKNQSVAVHYEVCVQLPMSADDVTLLASAAEHDTGCAAIDRYLLPAGPTAANPPQRRAAA